MRKWTLWCRRPSRAAPISLAVPHRRKHIDISQIEPNENRLSKPTKDTAMAKNSFRPDLQEPPTKPNCLKSGFQVSSSDVTGCREIKMPRFAVAILNSEERAREKQASCERDQKRLNSGEVSREELARENGFFSSLPLEKFRISSIGGRPIEKIR